MKIHVYFYSGFLRINIWASYSMFKYNLITNKFEKKRLVEIVDYMYWVVEITKVFAKQQLCKWNVLNVRTSIAKIYFTYCSNCEAISLFWIESFLIFYQFIVISSYSFIIINKVIEIKVMSLMWLYNFYVFLHQYSNVDNKRNNTIIKHSTYLYNIISNL